MRREYPYNTSEETPCLHGVVNHLTGFLAVGGLASGPTRSTVLYRIGRVAIYYIFHLDNTNRSMAAKQGLQKEDDRNFDFSDSFLTLNEYPQGEEDDPVSESCSSSRSECAKSSSANYRASCASPVEAWINEEFGDDVEASHDEADSYTTLIRQVGEYIDRLDFVHGTTHSIYSDHVDADVMYPGVDSDDVEMFYEPQLWCFT